jgi:glycosyltransferase involved in cell wall biosynthesis
MKIIMIHNRYRYQGGEDAVFQAESLLLTQWGHIVRQMVFDNKDIPDNFEKYFQGLRGIYNVGSALALQKLIDEFQPDIIHVHNFFPLASPSIFYAAKKYHIPIVVTLHNFRLVCPSGSLYFNGKIYEENIHKLIPWSGIFKGVYRNSRMETLGLAGITVLHNLIGTWKNKIDKFIVLTEFARKKFGESALRVNEEQFVVKPNFVDDFGPGDASREKFFLFAGRLSTEKGIDVVLKALAVNKFKLIIIGDGPLKGRVTKACETNPEIHYLGFQQRETIIGYLKRCTALLLPSVCYEGFPISLLESFATGTPVIASRLGPLAEIVADNENGLHFDAGNPPDLSAKISILSNDPPLASRLGTNARVTYLNNYTPEKNYHKLMDIYTRLPNIRVAER